MSSLSKMPLITFLFALLFVDLSIAGYVLEDDYTPSNFFSMFSFFTSADPTNGFVDYVDQSTAQSAGYISTTSNTVHIGTDHENNTPSGRPSVRLTSNKAYNVGSLVILDLEHMPGGICGTWPAFWMVGPNWPSGGEIDILEGVNEQSSNAMTLHTDSGCSITNDGNFTGSVSTFNCDVDASDQSANAGCSIDSSDSQTYGSGFNSNGGGVYATEWTNSSISIWFFPRGSIPGDITAGSPNPSSAWGTPTAQFQGGCDIPQFFQDNQLVFDLTYCGDWAGEVWSSSSCSSKADTCIDYVQNNPSAFEDAYWTINSLQVFQYSASASYSTTSVVASTSYALSTYPVVVSSETSSLATSSSMAEATSSSTSFSAYSSASSSASSYEYSSSSFATSLTSSLPASSSLSLSESPSSTSSDGWWHNWHTPATASSAISSGTGTTTFASLSATFLGKAVSFATDAATTNSSSNSTISSPTGSTTLQSNDSTISTSNSMAASSALSASQTNASTLSVQTSSVATGMSTVASLASTMVLSTGLASAAGSVSSAVPTSQAEVLAKVKAMAEEWATSEPGNWRDEINAIEEAIEAASSQAAAVSAKLSANQRRHILQHKRRFSGHL